MVPIFFRCVFPFIAINDFYFIDLFCFRNFRMPSIELLIELRYFKIAEKHVAETTSSNNQKYKRIECIGINDESFHLSKI